MGMNKESYLHILDKIKEKHDRIESAGKNSNVLIIDGLNTVIRAHVMNPSLNEDGYHIGAQAGFLKSIGYAIRKFDATRCIVVFDGKGGSKRRRKILPEYKAGRKGKRNYNRAYGDMEDPEETLSRQMYRIVEYLETLPVTTISIDSIEADDVIAYITQNAITDPDEHIMIMSTDKDFLQLVDDRVRVWSPTKKKIYGPEEVMDEYEVPSCNMLVRRIIEGDKSDNIPGVYGIGPKTIKKKLGSLLDCENRLDVDEILAFARDNENESNTYKRLLENEDVLERNWALMQLYDVDISGNKKTEILDHVHSDIPDLDISQFRIYYMEDKMWSAFPSVDSWLKRTFMRLDNFGS